MGGLPAWQGLNSVRVSPSGAIAGAVCATGTRPVRSTWAGCVGTMSVVTAKEGGPASGPKPTDRGMPGTKHHLATEACGMPLGLRLTGANRRDDPPMAPPRCRAAGDHRPTVRRPRPARAMSPGCHKRVRLPSDPKVPRSMLANRRAWPSAVRQQGKGCPRARRRSQRLHGPPPARAAGLEPAGDAGSPSSRQGGPQRCLPASPAIHAVEPDGLVRRAVGAYS